MHTTQNTVTNETLNNDTVSKPIERPAATDPPSEKPPRRHWVGWVFVAAALVAVAGLTMALVGGSDSSEPRAPIGDAKDHPGFGQVTPVVAESVGDAKDNPAYGPVTPIEPRTRDDILRDLVARGVVPAATLDDGTLITGPALAPRTRDDIVRDLVARGVVPAATLDDGSQITSRSLEP